MNRAAQQTDWLTLWLLGAALLACALSFWPVVIAAAGLALGTFCLRMAYQFGNDRQRVPPGTGHAPRRESPTALRFRVDTNFDARDDAELEGAAQSATDERTIQTWTRVQGLSGDRLEGRLAIHFEPGQTQMYLHIPFSPTFQTVPQAYCECSDESAFQAEFDVLQPYGARLNVRRRGIVKTTNEVEICVVLNVVDAAQRAA